MKPNTQSDSPIAESISDVDRSHSDTNTSTTNPTDTSNQILDIVFEYALNKFNDTMERLAIGKPKFLSVIEKFVQASRPISISLPAFPFKSANKVYKVLGILPDKAEELALKRLNTMCIRIQAIYAPGAQLTIISDGLVYNDLLGILDRDTWAYGEALRAMAVEKKFTHIDFSRLKDLIQISLPDKMTQIIYAANATNFRRLLLNRYGKDDIDIDHAIATDPDTLMTYRGYCRFLESDLQYIYPTGKTRSKNAYKREVKFLAKEMLIRGYAFAGAVKHAFPEHLRLSIHQSTGEHKVSMSLLDTKTGYTTPWHCSVALMANGEWLSAPFGDFNKDPKMQIVYEEGRPSYFQEISEEQHEPTGNQQLSINTSGKSGDLVITAPKAAGIDTLNVTVSVISETLSSHGGIILKSIMALVVGSIFYSWPNIISRA